MRIAGSIFSTKEAFVLVVEKLLGAKEVVFKYSSKRTRSVKWCGGSPGHGQRNSIYKIKNDRGDNNSYRELLKCIGT